VSRLLYAVPLRLIIPGWVDKTPPSNPRTFSWQKPRIIRPSIIIRRRSTTNLPPTITVMRPIITIMAVTPKPKNTPIRLSNTVVTLISIVRRPTSTRVSSHGFHRLDDWRRARRLFPPLRQFAQSQDRVEPFPPLAEAAPMGKACELIVLCTAGKRPQTLLRARPHFPGKWGVIIPTQSRRANARRYGARTGSPKPQFAGSRAANPRKCRRVSPRCKLLWKINGIGGAPEGIRTLTPECQLRCRLRLPRSRTPD
jgi:hypothetical protein